MHNPPLIQVGSDQSTCSVLACPPALAYVIFSRSLNLAGGGCIGIISQ